MRGEKNPKAECEHMKEKFKNLNLGERLKSVQAADRCLVIKE